MEHLEETSLALYVLKAPELRERRAEIAAHLGECPGCAQLHAEIVEYYAEVDALRTTSADGTVQGLPASTRIALTPPEPKGGPLTTLKRSSLQSFVTSFKAYPVRWTGGFAIAVAAILLLMPRLLVKDANPAYSRAKDEFLIALNKNGDELWRKFMGPGFEAQSQAVSESPRLLDLDKDGSVEILAMTPLGSSGLNRWIECFNPDGSERWRFQFHHPVQFGTETFSDPFPIKETIAIRDFFGNGEYEIAFAAHHSAWWPSVVGLLSAKDGRLSAEYWHPGWLDVKAKDIDGDGIEEILAWGYNNAFKKNVLAVLDPHTMGGHAPATSEFTPQGIPAAAEKFYVRLPDPDLYDFSTRTNVATSLFFLQGPGFEIRTSRDVLAGELGYRSAEVFFTFDDHMKCVKIRLADEFVNIHRRLEKEGKVRRNIDEKYLEDLRNNVEYWDGEKFVKALTMNGKYGSVK